MWMEVGAFSVDDLRPKRKTLTRAEYLSSQRHLRRLDMSGEATDHDFDDDDVHRCKLIPLRWVRLLLARPEIETKASRSPCLELSRGPYK
jgi:hypothetical protein